MANKMIITATINNATEQDIKALNVLFDGRITIKTEEVKDTRKDAPKPQPKPDNTDNKPTTYAEGIRAWQIKKYGSEERADKVNAMTKLVREEWAETARKTGKFVVKRSEYKDKLFEEAFRRVLAEEEAAKKAAEEAKKASTTKRGRKAKA